MITDPSDLMKDFARVAALSGFMAYGNIRHEVLRAPHQPPALPPRTQAVYAFSVTNSNLALKVGKAGPKSKARFEFQHYNPNSSRSNLAKSLLNRSDLWPKLEIHSLSDKTVGQWIMDHTDRDHFFMHADQGTLLPSLLEIFVQCRLRPVFEGSNNRI